MAYFGKLGCLMRQTVAKSLLQKAGTGSVALPAVFLLQRGMASSKLFIGGLAWGTDEGAIRDAFSAFGEVTEVKIICDRDTGRSRGFGFVSFTSESEAGAALQEMDGRDLGGRTIRVDYADSNLFTLPTPQLRGSPCFTGSPESIAVD
ncbi:unnamed protein product [Sphagnum troendelagicum]|uniref:RRM domain-containing protein n=1 Tax=Sphagnum troendelagicum TaxID=128251 RepID=A0ABP0TGL3_9BRYO